MTVPAVTQPQTIDLNFELDRGFAARFIRSKARQLRGRPALQSFDEDDIRQELAMAVCLAHPIYDPEFGEWPAFVATVVERRIVRLLEAAGRTKRTGGRLVLSLNNPVEGADGTDTTLADIVRLEQLPSAQGRDSADAFQLADARMDAETVMKQLNTAERKLALEIVNQSQSRTAGARGISRKTVRLLSRKTLKRLRGQ